MSFRVALYCPDRAVTYDGRTPDTTGIGGGVTARTSLLASLAATGHDVTAYVNCTGPVEHAGVHYMPLDRLERIDADVLIAISTGGKRTFAPLTGVPIKTSLRMLWVQGVPQPAGLEIVAPDVVCAASNFLRDVCVNRWSLNPAQMFVCYNGLHQARFAAVEASLPDRNPFALAYIGPPEKGLSASLAILQRLRVRDSRYTLDVFGGNRLWGAAEVRMEWPDGVTYRGMLGQRDLVARLFQYEYCLAPQAIEEGFGIGVQEAKRAGQIVLASAVGAFPELFRTSVDGFLIGDAHDTAAAHDAFAARIDALARDPSRRKRIRARARTTPWDWDLAARTWTAFWEDVLGRSKAPRVRGRNDDELVQLPDGRHSRATGHYYPDVYPASPMLDRVDRTNRVLIGGGYGHGNLGDEAVLQVMLEQLREAVPNLSPVVASADPDRTRREHDVVAVGDRDVPALIDAAAASDLIIAGGGGLFQDYWGVPAGTLLSRRHWGLAYYNAFPALAELHDKPFMLFSVGIGPLETAEGRRQTRLAFLRADAATVRDRWSLALLSEIGTDTARIDVAADPAFLVEPAPRDHIEALLREIGIAKRPPRLIAVCLRQWDIGVDRDRWMKIIARALDLIAAGDDTRLLFLPFQTGKADRLTDDTDVADRIGAVLQRKQAITVCRQPLDAPQVSGLLGACDVVMAMRAHAAILGAVGGTPIVALAYDPKVSAVMAELGFPELSVNLRDVSINALVDLVAAAWRDREAIRSQLSTRVSQLRGTAAASTRKAVQLLCQRPYAPAPVSADWRAHLSTTLVHHVRRAEAADSRTEQLAAEIARLQDALTAVDEAETMAAADAQPNIVDDLRQQLERRTHEVATATTELVAIQQSRAWRLLTAYRALRRQPRRIAAGAYRRVRGVARRVRNKASRVWRARDVALARLNPATPVRKTRDRLDRWLTAKLMNPYVFLFDRFKRARMATYGPHLAGVSASCTPGLVSIVVPAHNGAATIASAIDSVLAQTYQNLELIIVDDGSTDDTGRIAAEYAARDPRIRLITQGNHKLSRALSRGFGESRGEFLTWTSCDNRLKPDFCEKLVGCLQRHPGWDMAYANLDIIGEDGEYLRGTGYYEGYQRPRGSEHIFMPEAPLELNVWAINSIGGAFMYRRRIAVLVGDYSPYRFIGEDYDYWMRINALGMLRHADFNEPIYDYCFRSGSPTSRWEEFRMLEHRDRLMIFEEFRRDFYLVPMLWIVDAEPSASRAETAIDRQRRRVGHLRYTGTYPLQALPRLWLPAVHLRIAAAGQASIAPDGALSHALKVFVTTDEQLPSEVHEGWDLCCALGHPSTLPRLPDGRGWIAAPDAALLVHAIDVRAKSAHLARIEAEAEAPPTPEYTASVVICSHRFNSKTSATLESVLQQQCDRSYEILLVHNTSAAPPARAVPPGASVPVREIVCPIPGLSAARNAAIAEARGGIICFLDDDAVADPAWLQRLCEAFEAQPEAGVIGGHIYLNTPASRPAALRPGWERYWSHFVTGYSGYTRVQRWWEFPWGANWAARRAALVLAGGFRTRYGRIGENFWGGEELVVASVIQKLGYAVGVLPEAGVRHDVDPARFTYAHARRTLRAGHQVSYAAQRDLYVANDTGIRRTFSDFFTSHHDESIPAEYRHWRNVSHRKRAQFRLLLVQLRDLSQRLRKPAVTLEPR